MKVKPKIVASRDFFPTCAQPSNTLQNGFSFTKEAILLE
jgi:hypothetical protein